MAEAIEQRQSRLLSALAGRELLLREIHHRVKNNLQIIISLFNLLARNAEDEATKLLIRDMLARVESLALVHHAAYQSDDVQLISMRSFRSEKSRVRQECVKTCRFGWWPFNYRIT